MHEYLNDWQRHCVVALQTLKKICDEENIRFYLLAGTLLGAVRHQGMIPWDDDIDVGFLREDWLKLRRLLQSGGLEGTEFEYKDEELDLSFPRLYGKILYNNRACIDLFLIVRWTDNALIGNLAWKLKHAAVSLYKYSVHYIPPSLKKLHSASWQIRIYVYIIESLKVICYWITYPFFRRQGYINVCRRIERLFERRRNGPFVNLYSIYSMEKEKILESWLYSTSYVQFEGTYYLTVGNTHAYLTHLYGDYMTPPSESARKETHIEYF